ncbi:MAG: thiol-disulfide oxidoreductase [Gemmataceae bacterium]|nr:thiol-disulfide oxidoreductase [Gemmataceae bacterium]
MTPRTRTTAYHASAAIAFCLVGTPVGAAERPTAIPDLSFRPATGPAVAWKDLAGKKATVVAFLSFDCPVSTSYAQPLAELAAAHADKGVAFVAFVPTDDDAATVARQAAEFKLGFPVFKDDKLVAADALGATTTPQAFVLDDKNAVRYRGRIDDGYALRLVPNKKVTDRSLANALDAVLTGKPVPAAKTDPVGCRIVRDRETRTVDVVSPVYHKDVLPILQTHCQSCHRPGAVGPFALMTYKQAVAWADDIKEFTRDRRMPPWKPRGGKEFVGDRRLTEKEIDTLARWVDAGCPEGDPKDAPPPRTFPDGWVLGKPDLVIETPDEFVVGPTGRDHFRVFVLPTGLTEDKYVVAFEVRPGNPRVVHHAANFFDTTGAASKIQALGQAEEQKRRKPGAVDVGPGYESVMVPIRLTPADLFAARPSFGPVGGWAPGYVPRELPAGTGMLLPKGSDFVMQLHYHRTGRVEKDRTRVGLYFAKKPVDRPLLPLLVPGTFKIDQKSGSGLGYIPAGDANFVARGSWYALEDCTVHAVMPHMHLLGKSVKMTMTPPGRRPELVIEIPEWDYNWQESYLPKDPMKVKAGTRFEIEAVFDNSAKNPNNPHDPPVDVRFGEQTTDEMLFGFFGATKDNPTSGLPFVIAQGPFRLTR